MLRHDEDRLINKAKKIIKNDDLFFNCTLNMKDIEAGFVSELLFMVNFDINDRWNKTMCFCPHTMSESVFERWGISINISRFSRGLKNDY